jgi:hypothetical protein
MLHTRFAQVQTPACGVNDGNQAVVTSNLHDEVNGLVWSTTPEVPECISDVVGATRRLVAEFITE